MVLFGIPDIRLFWSQDPRFTRQFEAGKISTFKPYSKNPPCYQDVSFWIEGDFHENDFCEIVRDVAGDLAEETKLVRALSVNDACDRLIDFAARLDR
jgi:phenylalanyl-tRNA synthetase alpha chain